MTPVQHIAVINESKANDSDVAFWTEAARLQLPHLCRAWGLPVPGIAFYKTKPPGAALLAVVDDDGNPESSGFHGQMAGLLVYALVDIGQSGDPCVTLSHEVLEMVVNPYLTFKVAGPSGRQLHVEVCDPVARSTYPIDVEVLGKRQTVAVADFVRPSWFGLTNHDDSNRHIFSGQLLMPFQVGPGGYYVAEVDGLPVVTTAPEGARINRNTRSRTWRLVQGAGHERGIVG